MARIEAPRGTLDVLPSDQRPRQHVLAVAEAAARRYGYEPLTIPTFEDTGLFARTAGEGSDVVAKEMYTFEDRAGRQLSLRPEATAGACRVYVEHGLHRSPQPFKALVSGPMFRYATPQKGRYREFWQVDVEAIGSDDPAIDAELVELFAEIAAGLGLEAIRLELNSIGCRECRPAYLELLGAWLAANDGLLDEDARQKVATSPLRVFDVKSERVRSALVAAPTIGDSLCAPCREHFAEVRALLDAVGVGYVLAPALVRGLDYYSRTVFEFVNESLAAAQSTVCAGGRYDYLVEEIGGQPTPGIGWAAGVERLALSIASPPASGVDVFVALTDGARRAELAPVLRRLRRSWRCETDYAGRSLKGQLTQAGRLGARLVAIVEPEQITIREHGTSDVEVESVGALADHLERRLAAAAVAVDG